MKKILLLIFIIFIFGSVLLFKYGFKKDRNITNTKISYYIENNKDRYKNYKKKNPNKKDEEIILEVNIGLDNDYYSNTRKSKLLKELTLVNKYNYLEKDYVPNNLKVVDNTRLISYACDSFNLMRDEMKELGLNIIAISGYRSYEYQDKLYEKYSIVDGIDKADTYSARPGYSEHQTGLAVDISNGSMPYTMFENTKEYKWMINNSYKYGFILRYPKGKERITGYSFESWHYRYVGIKVSTYLKKHNITFDEYYALNIEPYL